MWELVSDLEEISSITLEDSTVLFLDFQDGSLLLLSVEGESSTELEQESSSLTGSIGSVCAE